MEEQLSKTGRPTKYSEEMALEILELAYRGKTDLEICRKLKIAVSSLYLWKDKYPDFSEALKKAKEISDQEVEASLRKRAMGYKHKSIKFWYDKDAGIVSQEYTEHYPPDTTALIFWLKNRQPQLWREKRESELDKESELVLSYKVDDL